MELTDFGMGSFIFNLPGYVQLRTLRVKVEALHFDLEGQVYSGRGCGAGVLDCRDAPDCAGAENIAWADQVVGVPLGESIV